MKKIFLVLILAGCSPKFSMQPLVGDRYECDIEGVARKLGEYCVSAAQMGALLERHGEFRR